VKAAHFEVASILRRSGGVISRKNHPNLVGTLDRMLREKRLIPVLPGIYADPSALDDPCARIAAAALWAPDGVITRSAAARLSYWPDIPVPSITIALPGHRSGLKGFRVESWRPVAPEHVTHVEGITITRPALTVIDLVRETGIGDPIDVALRTRATTIGELTDVFTSLPHRRGNELCATLIADSQTEPWSPPERSLHRLMRSAGITGWVANQATIVGSTRRIADVRFDRIRLAIEVDGYQVHSRRDVFEDDRARQNAFVLDGWTVLRFTARQIADRPAWVIGQILEAIEMLAPKFGMSPSALTAC
jgi:very-short-patch-repair endonuclease